MGNYYTARHIYRFLFLFLLMLSMYSCGSGGSSDPTGDRQPPTTPSNLTAEGVSASEIRLQWIASSDDTGVENYKIYESGNTAPVANVSGTEQSVNITGLEPSTRHCYYVVAFDGAGNSSEKTAVVCAETPAGIPSVPAGLSVSGNPPAREASLSWAPSTDDTGVTGYRVYRNGSLLTTVTDTSFTDSGLQLDTNYIYSVSAFDESGNESGRSTEATVNLYRPPPVPEITAIGNSAAREVNLSWSVSSGGEVVTGYRVYRDGNLLTTLAGTSFTDSGLDLSRNYCFRVSSVDAAGNESDKSNESCVRLDDIEKPSVPSGLTATEDLAARQANLSWTASTDNIGIAGYKVYRDGNLVTNLTGTSFTDSGLESGKDYIYSVSAYDVAGNESDRSNPLTVKLEDKEPPSVPTGLSATPETANMKILLSWLPSTDNIGVKGYKVYRAGSSTPLTSVTGTSFTDSGLELGKDYRYSVSAYDESGNESGKSTELTVRLNDIEKPTVPGDFKAEASPGLLEIKLTWTASTDNVGVTGYRVYRNAELIKTVTGTSWDDSNVKPSADYSYSVSAIDAAGNESEKSTESAVRLPPMPPTGLTVTPDSAAKVILLSWSAPAESNGIKEYKIYRDGVFLASSSETSWTDSSDIIIGTRYCYKVSIVDTSDAESEKCSEVCSSIDDQVPPTPPENLKVEAVSSSEIKLEWGPATDNIGVVKYRIYRDNGSGIFETIREIPHVNGISVYRFSDSGLNENTQYCYKVSALDQADHESVDNPEGCARTVAPDLVPPTPATGLKATAVSASEIKLEWGPATDNVGVKEYHISRNSGSGWSLIKTIPHLEAVSLYSYNDINLSASTEYSYRVSAVDASGNESVDNPSVTSTTLPDVDIEPPSPAPLLEDLAYYGPDEGIGLSWSPSSDNVGVAGYTITRSIDGVVSATFKVEGDLTGFHDWELTVSGNYCYTVTAFDAAGNKSDPSGSQCIMLDLEPPPTPWIETYYSPNDGGAVIQWGIDPIETDITYTIYRKISSGNYEYVTSLTDQYEWIDTSYSPTTAYCYKIIARDSSGNSSASQESCVP